MARPNQIIHLLQVAALQSRLDKLGEELEASHTAEKAVLQATWAEEASRAKAEEFQNNAESRLVALQSDYEELLATLHDLKDRCGELALSIQLIFIEAANLLCCRNKELESELEATRLQFSDGLERRAQQIEDLTVQLTELQHRMAAREMEMAEELRQQLERASATGSAVASPARGAAHAGGGQEDHCGGGGEASGFESLEGDEELKGDGSRQEEATEPLVTRTNRYSDASSSLQSSLIEQEEANARLKQQVSLNCYCAPHYQS